MMPNKPLLVTGPAKTTGGKVIHTFINFTPWLTPNGRSCTRHNETTGMEPGGGRSVPKIWVGAKKS